MREANAEYDNAHTQQEPILLTDRDFLLFGELMSRAVEPNALVLSEIAEFNKGSFDEQRRYHW